MGTNENAYAPGLMQFKGGLSLGDAKFAPQVSQNSRRVLGVINENINIRAPGIQPIAVKNAFNPITRKYAAQIVSQQHKKHVNDCGKHTLGSIEEFANARDSQILINDEVDVEDVEEEDHIMDIDSCDVKNELAVIEYVDDIYSFYRKSEKASLVAPAYMDGQSDINERMRAILIDWLIEVHYKFELMEETLFLTVSLIDRFLEQHEVARNELQLVGITSMLMACKYEEVSVPVVEDFVYISDKAYTRQQILDMERLMLNTLQFNMSVPTPYVFLKRFLKAAQSDKKLELMSFFMIELCLVEYEMLKFQPSMLAAAAVYTAICTIDGPDKQWSKTAEWHSQYTENELMECAKMMVLLHHKSSTGKLTGVHRKYSTAKFGYATSCEPAQFLLSK